MSDNPTPNPRDVINSMFDKGFNRVANLLSQAYARDVQRGLLATRLQQLQDEAQRLSDAGQKMTATNPVLRAFLADLEIALDEQARLASALGADIQEGTLNDAQKINRLLALGNITQAQLTALGITWNTPRQEILANLLQFTSSQQWRNRLSALPDDIFKVINNQILLGIARGQNPLRIAGIVSSTIRGTNNTTAYPLYMMQNLLRTLQLTTYREASRAIAVANADLITHKIRVATLDMRTCLACVALHGSEMRVDQRVDDHYSGRCIAIPVVRGRSRFVRTGETWFNSLTPQQQLMLAGQANYNALTEGAVQLRDFVREREDDLFGMQIVEASLKGILGEQAQRYYARSF